MKLRSVKLVHTLIVLIILNEILNYNFNFRLHLPIKTYYENLKSYFNRQYKNYMKNRYRQCIQNQKEIDGALELYLMQVNFTRTTPVDLETLYKLKYLKSVPICNENGKYIIAIKYVNYNAKNTNPLFNISCSIHDTVDNFYKLYAPEEIFTY